MAIVLPQLSFLKSKSQRTIITNAVQRLTFANSHFESFYFPYIISKKR